MDVAVDLQARLGPIPALAKDRLIDVAPSLAALFPDQHLRRGSVVEVTAAAGSTSLLFSLLSEALARGSWVAIIGVPVVGLEAAASLGVRLDHLALVPRPGSIWPEVTAALVDAMDVVVLAPPSRCRPTDARQLAARAREKGSVLVVTSSWVPGERRTPSRWPEVTDIRLTADRVHWEGIGAGHGTLQRRLVEVASSGRRAAGRERRVSLWLPGPGGHLEAVDVDQQGDRSDEWLVAVTKAAG